MRENGNEGAAGLVSAPMPNPDSTLSPRLQKRLHRWLLRWGTPSLVKDLRVEFSPRLTRAFGRCYLEQKVIRLTASLKDSQSWLLPEILCHEAAHAAVYETWGERAKPHGSEWEEFMRMAGFTPRVRIPVVVRTSAKRRSSRSRVLYLHRCPNCERSRHATRPMRQWRCRACTVSGHEGELVIQRQALRSAPPRQAAAIGLRRRRSIRPAKRAASVSSSAFSTTRRRR